MAGGKNNRGAGGNAGNAGNRQPRQPKISKVDYTTPEEQADGTFKVTILADIVGGNGSEQVQFYLNRFPQGTEASVEQSGRTGYAQICTDTGLQIGTRYEIAAELVADGKIVGNRIARFVTLPKEVKRSRFAKSAALRRDEIELRRLERDLRELVREPSATAREIKDLQEQIALIKAHRERDDLSRKPSLLERATKNLGDQVTLAKLRKALRDLGRVPAKEIVRPVIECVGSGGHYTVSGCVVYKDSSFATGYPVLISVAPYQGNYPIEKVLTDEHGFFSRDVQFNERSADVHVIVGGTGGYEEYFDDVEGPRRYLGGRYNWKLWVAWAATLVLTIIGFLYVGFGSEPERTMLSGLPSDLAKNLAVLHPEWKAVEPGFWSWLGGWARTGYWTLTVLAWLGSLVFTPIALSDEFGLIAKSVSGTFSRRRRSGSQGSGPSQGGGAPAVLTTEPAELLKGKGPWVAFIVTLGAFIFDEIRERWMAKRARRMAKKIAGE